MDPSSGRRRRPKQHAATRDVIAKPDTITSSSDRPAGATVAARLDRLADRHVFLLVVVPLFLLFVATASTTRPYNIDAFSNVATAWKLGTDGTFGLDEYNEFNDPEYLGIVGWFVPAGDSTATQYPPGAAVWAAPFYAVTRGDLQLVESVPTNAGGELTVEIPIPPLGPAAVAASLAVALALGFLALSVRSFAPGSVAVTVGYLGGLGTTAWGVASDSLWQHGPAMMWIAIAGLLAARERYAASGFAYGAAILTRTVTAVIPAGVGITVAAMKRSWRSLLSIGLASAAGLALVVLYNAATFGEPSISGGYGDGFADRAVSFDLVQYARNVAGGLLDPTRGLIPWSPFIVVLIPGIIAAWRAAPAWVRGGGIGAVLYLALQWKANRFSGGEGFIGYRYPLEALTAAAPLLALAYTEWVAKHRIRRTVFTFAAVIAVLLQVYANIRMP